MFDITTLVNSSNIHALLNLLEDMWKKNTLPYIIEQPEEYLSIARVTNYEAAIPLAAVSIKLIYPAAYFFNRQIRKKGLLTSQAAWITRLPD